MKALLLRLQGVTAHFRDPRLNTAKIGLPARTLHAPPPCTIHGLICAAAGGWVKPETLVLGWRMDYDAVNSDFGRNQLPQRKEYNQKLGLQKTSPSPVEREFLSFPVLSILAFDDCIQSSWFRRPANPLSLGRAEDMITDREWQEVEVERRNEGEIARQCVPMNSATGTLYAAPLYFAEHRQPVGMAPRTDAVRLQEVRSPQQRNDFAYVASTRETFYIWDFSNATR